MEPNRESAPNPDGPDALRTDRGRGPVRRVVRQRQPPADRSRRAAPLAPPEEETPPPAAAPPEEVGPHPCPFCGGEVSGQAVVCRHCGRDLVAASGVRLVLPEEKWNTEVPPWMLEQERQFLQRRRTLGNLRQRLAQAFLALIVLGTVAILYRVYTAPVPPHLRHHTATTVVRDTTVSNVTMASANHEAAVAVAPSAAEPAPDAVPTATPTAPENQSAETPSTLRADELIKAFQADHAQANEQYLDQPLRISGRVETLHADAQVPYLTLHSPNAIELRCYLSSTAMRKLNRLRPGANVLIQGRCQGWFNNITVADCDIP